MNETGVTQATRDEAYGGGALVALFADTQSAREAGRRLREEGFHKVWIGITHAVSQPYGAATTDRDIPASERDTLTTGTTDPRDIAPAGRDRTAPGRAGDTEGVLVETDAETFGEKLGRFFTGEDGARSLYGELVRHGVARDQARSIEDQIPLESAILTVDGHNHPEAAAAILEQSGGHIVAGESFADDVTGYSAAPAAFADAAGTTSTAPRAAFTGDTGRRGSDVLGYRDAQRYARGAEIDEQRRVQLRSERLDVDKRREPIGEATVGKDVVENQQEFDVPVVREELFVERRPASATTPAGGDTATFGEHETIRIPLMRERVVVTKRPVVTGEVVVGKRAVAETEHVSETTREEQLRVNDGTTGALGAGTMGASRVDERTLAANRAAGASAEPAAATDRGTLEPDVDPDL